MKKIDLRDGSLSPFLSNDCLDRLEELVEVGSDYVGYINTYRKENTIETLFLFIKYCIKINKIPSSKVILIASFDDEIQLEWENKLGDFISLNFKEKVVRYYFESFRTRGKVEINEDNISESLSFLTDNKF